MRHCFIALGLAVLFATTTAAAGAKQHFMAGQDYYSQGRYDKAIEEFEEAYRLDPKPLLLFNIAQSHEKLGNLVEAVTYLERYLKEDPNTDQRASLENKIRNLKARVAGTGIKLTCSHADASILVDGVEIGRTPYEGIVPVEVGSHKITISKPGFKDFVMNIAISAGHSVPIDATLESDGSGATTGPVIDGDDEVDDSGEEGGGGGFIKALPWIVTGVGVGTAAVGWLGLGLPAKSDGDHDKAVTADIIGIAGCAVAAAGITWGVISIIKGKKESGGAAMVVPVVDRNTAGLSATFTF